jgi:outer membrane protein assembly factor BamB
MKRTWVGLVWGAAAVLVAGGCSSGASDSSGTEGGRNGAATSPEPIATTTTAAPAPEPLEDQTPPTSINGITVDGTTLWVASIEDDQVLQVDQETGAILQRIDTEGAGPDDVALAPDGSVWTTGFTNGDLGRIADGAYEVVMNIEVGINPLEFGSDGTLYVGTYGKDGNLYALETDGGAPAEDAPAEVVAEGLPDINAFGVLADDTLVAPAGGLTGPSEAVLIDPATGKITTIVSDLPAVAAGATDADGVPYVLANITGEVIAVDVEAGTSEVAQTVEQGSPFDNLAFAADGTLYVSSFTAPAITVVSSDGTERVLAIGA